MHVRQVDVDLVDAVVLDPRRDRAHRVLEEPRVFPVRVEIGGQQHGVRRELRRLHQPHGRMQAQRARLVGRGRDDAATGVVAQCRERADRSAGAGVHEPRLVPAATTDDDRPADELRIAQQLDRRVEGVHVEMRDQSGGLGRQGRHGVGCADTDSLATRTRFRLCSHGAVGIKLRRADRIGARPDRPPPFSMSHKHDNLIRAIFHDPVSGNIQWREIESLLRHLGSSVESLSGTRVRVKLNGHEGILHRPHGGNTLGRQDVLHLREYLAHARVTPSLHEADKKAP